MSPQGQYEKGVVIGVVLTTFWLLYNLPRRYMPKTIS